MTAQPLAGDWLGVDRDQLASERILDAASARFAEHGVSATGMGEIARAAGCSRATLYRYFENRRALHVALVHREARRIGAAVTAEVAAVTDPEARVVEAMLAAIREVRSRPLLAACFRLDDSGLASDLANASEVIAGLGASFLGASDDPEVVARARWIVRVIVSLLTAPGADAADERAMIERFVAPYVIA